ncbi:MAG: CHAT domain-containing protein [Ekhidna sp.]
MTHYLPAIFIVRRGSLSLCLFIILPLFEIKSNPTLSGLYLDECLTEKASMLDLAHLYFEGILDIEMDGSMKISEVANEERMINKFLDLLATVRQFKSSVSRDVESAMLLGDLIERMEIDIALLDELCTSDPLSPYVMDYAYLDRKSSYYAIMLDWMIDGVADGLMEERDLTSFFKVVLHFLDGFYASGLINAFRKNEQTEKHNLLEKMLGYIHQSDAIENRKFLIKQIFKVSRQGEVASNRHALSLSSGYSGVLSELLAQIEAVEQPFYQKNTIDNLVKYHRIINGLREKYLKIIRSMSPKENQSMDRLTKNLETTTIVFFSGENYTHQYVENSSKFQLIQHSKCMIAQSVTDVIEEMDQALFEFSGSAHSLKHMQGLLRSMSSSIIQPIEITLDDKIRIIADGQLCFFPFEMLMTDENKYLFESHEIMYQFDFKETNEMVHLEDIYNVKGEFDGKLRLAGFTGYNELSFKRFKAIASDNSLLHLGTHQIMVEDEPYILLNKSDSMARSDWFNVPDIMGVLMSMCAGFRGRLTSGENARSFGNRAYESGAESIISSLWSVDDYATGRLIEQYFDYLNKGMSSGKSLRQSKLKYLAETDAFHRHPVFWAAFVHYGSNYSMERKPNYLLLLFLFLLPILVLKFKIRVRY